MAGARRFIPPQEFDEYRLVRPLGSGAMGQVYLCHDTVLDRQVAVKFILHLGDDTAARERFLLEARAIARLSHPNVVAIYRVGQVGGYPFLVSEFVRGQPLDQMKRPVPWTEALRIGLDLSRGLAAAHKNGVLHRDIKPGNALCGDDGRIRLCDFGLAKLVGENPHRESPSLLESLDDQTQVSGLPDFAAPTLLAAAHSLDHSPSLTRTGSIMGTPLYMSPEAWRGEKNGTFQMDVYSLGVVLFQLVAGRPPHADANLAALAFAVHTQDAPPLAEVVADVDRGYAAVVQRCLQRDPKARYRSGEELCEALEQVAAAHQRGSPAAGKRVPVWRTGAAVLLLCLVATSALLGFRSYQRAQRRSMALLPGGTFSMGSSAMEIDSAFTWCKRDMSGECVREIYDREQPVRQVRVSRFRIDRTEVTNQRFAAWLDRRAGLSLRDGRYVYEGEVLLADLYPSYHPAHAVIFQAGHYGVPQGFEERPVAQVTWDGALRYCRAQGKRLPTEAEWEFAARGVAGNRFPWGHDEPHCEGVVFARKQGHECAKLGQEVADVGTAPLDRTPDGILDLAGNVSEWVMDRFEPRYRPCGGTEVCVDPVVDDGPADHKADGKADGSEDRTEVLRVVRGGGWNLPASTLRAAARSRMPHQMALLNVGFRCAAPVAP